MTGVVTVSELAVADPYFALLGSIRGRRESLRREWAYCSQSAIRAKAKPFFVQKCMSALAELDVLEDLLDSPSIITNELSPSHALGSKQAGGFLDPSKPARSVREHAKGHSNSENVTATLSEVRRRFNALGTVRDQKALVFGVDPGEKSSITERWLQFVMDKLKSKSAQARLAEHKWRMIEEITERASQGWYIVFNTLTVDNNHYDTVFEKGSRAWSYYIREIETVIGKELYPTIRGALEAKKTEPFHTYFAIVERGSLHGRLHIHVIHCMKEIPGSWKRDPNQRLGPASNRQISAMKKLWFYGHSMPIACRFADFDAFGRLGWCWPVARKKGERAYKPIPTKPPIAIARYMCKYLLKSFTSKKDSYQWRTRVSNGFGLQSMRRIIETIPRETLWEFVQGERLSIQVNDRSLPTSRLRVECLRSLLRPMRNGQPESEESLLRLQTIRRSLTEVSPQRPIVERLRSLSRRIPGCSSQSITPFVVQSSKNTAAFDVAATFRAAYERPQNRFSPKGGVPRRRVS